MIYLVQNVPASVAAASVQDAAQVQAAMRPGLPLFQKADYGAAWPLAGAPDK